MLASLVLLPALSFNFVDATSLEDAVKRSDAVLTFTRASEGSYTTSTGAVIWFSPNLVQQSQTFDHAGWVKAGADISADVETGQDGTMTADKLEPVASATSARIQQGGVPVKLGLPYCYSIHVKAAEFDWIRFRPSGSMGDVSMYFNATTGTIGASLGGDNIRATAVDCGDGWWRLALAGYADADGNTTCQVYLAGGDGVATFPAATAGEGVYIWGAQFMRGITAQDYIPTVGAVAGYRARLGDRGLLREDAATNLQPYSQDLTNGWTFLAATPSGNATTAPDGTLTADKLIEDVGSDYHRTTSPSHNVVDTTGYSVSIFAKMADAARPMVLMQTTGNLDAGLSYFDTSDGTLGTQHAAHTDGKMEALANGWYRISFNVVAVGTGGNSLLIYGLPAETIPWVGDGTSGIYLWGAQFEVGSEPTSYITTTAAGVARATDVVTVENIDASSWWNADAGTQVVTAEESGAFVGTPRLVSYNDTALNSTIDLWPHSNASVHQNITNAGAAQGNIASGSNRVAGVFKVAHAWAENDMAFSVNGGALAFDTSVDLPLTLDTMTIGSDQSGGNGFSGYIHAIDYFGSRRPDAPLQALAA